MVSRMNVCGLFAAIAPACAAGILCLPIAATPCGAGAGDDDASSGASDEKKAKEEGWNDLFNKKDLDGWFTSHDWGEIKIVDEAIHLKANKKFFLLTKKEYADFVFEGEILMPEGKANSGFMFRCAAEQNNVWGYQAEVDPSERQWSGGLYDEGRRGWLNPKTGDDESIGKFLAQGDPFKPGEWNRYRIHAEGDRLQIWVNDVQMTDYRDSMDSQGHIGIQHHGERGKVYRFRNLRVKELAPAFGEEVELFDGESLDGWTQLNGSPPSEGWIIDDDAIHRKEKATPLVAAGDYENFVLEFEWKIPKGGRGALGYRMSSDNGKTVGPVYAILDQEERKEEAEDKMMRSGAMRGLVSPDDKAVPKKAGEYNQSKIIVYRKRIEHQLNGKRSFAVSTASGSWKRAIDGTEYESVADFGNKKGRIALFDGGSRIWFKNIKIRELR